MKKTSILVFAIFAFGLTSCKDGAKETEPEIIAVDNTGEVVEIYEVAKSEAEFNDPNVEAVFEQYINVESALVNTDSGKTAAESSKLLHLLNEMDGDDSMRTAVEGMKNTEDVEEQRKQFVVVTEVMEKMLQGALKSGTIYKQYCPMAFGDTGAYWLSTSRDILNPYFGDKMLKCGRVDSEISNSEI